MVVLGLAVATPARQALRTAELLRAEVFRAVERDQHTAAEPLEGAQSTVPAQPIQGLVRRAAGARDALGRAWRGYGCQSGRPSCRTGFGSSTSSARPAARADGRGTTRSAGRTAKRPTGRYPPCCRSSRRAACQERPRRPSERRAKGSQASPCRLESHLKPKRNPLLSSAI